MLRGAGLMLGGGFKSFGGAMLALGSSTVSWAGIGVPGMIAGGFVIGAGASDMKQGWEEFFLGLSGDSTTQTRNMMSDWFYDGNDGIYHWSTGLAAFAGSLLTPYVNTMYGKTGTTAAGSTAGNGETAGTMTAGKATGVRPTVTEAAGGTVDDALEQFYDDIFESSYGEQFDPVREQAIAAIESGSKTIDNAIPNVENAIINPKKLTEYALNPNHPVGGNKARVFESALGYNQSNANDLMKQIYDNLSNSEAVLGKLDNYGQRYTVDILVTGPNGNTVNVRTGWIIKTGSDVPELTTIYVKN